MLKLVSHRRNTNTDFNPPWLHFLYLPNRFKLSTLVTFSHLILNPLPRLSSSSFHAPCFPFSPFSSSSSTMALKRISYLLFLLLWLSLLSLFLHEYCNAKPRATTYFSSSSSVPRHPPISRKVLSSKFDFTPFRKLRHRHHHRRQPNMPAGAEIDPRYGVEKRLVPTGPNPLHHWRRRDTHT